MKKYKIIVQKTLYSGDTDIKKLKYKDRIIKKEIECDSVKFNYDEILITKDNIEKALKIDKNYKIGDIIKLPLDSVSFIRNDEEIENVNVFADPYYKLYEMIDGKYKEIDIHHH